MRSLPKGLPRQPKDDGHFAAMPYTEIPAFVAKLRERSSVGRVAMEVLILTAARSGEIRGATWSEFDLEKAMWSIPATRMKMGRAHFVPLAPQVLEALERAKAFSAPCTDLVFPGMKLKKTVRYALPRCCAAWTCPSLKPRSRQAGTVWALPAARSAM
jgi:integrase